MRKGKLGFSLTFYPVVGFILAIFNQWLLCFLVLGLAMALERDEWTTRQCMQAAFLGLFAMVADVVSGFFSGISSFIRNVVSYGDGGGSWLTTMTSVFNLISLIIWIAITALVFVFALLSVFKVARGQEANTPLVSGFVYRLYGLMRPAAPQGYGQPPMYPQGAPMQQPMYPPQGAAMPPPQQPMQPPPQQPPQV